MKTLNKLEKSRAFWFFLLLSCAFFLLRLPSLFEPYWYGDEGIYHTVGMALSKGRLLYRDIWDNKPPLLYIVYTLLSSDQFSVRLASLFAGIGSLGAFFLLAQKVFAPFGQKKRILFATAGIYTFLLATPLIEGNIANAENFMLLPIILSAFLIMPTPKSQLPRRRHSLWRRTANPNVKLILAGILLGVAFLFKTVAVFDFAAFLLFLAFTTYTDRHHIRNQVNALIPFVAAFALPILITIGILFLQGTFPDFYTAVFGQMVGYVSYGNTLVVPQGLLLLKLSLLAIALSLLFLKRKTFPPSRLFVFTWLAFSVFNAFFAQRPYTHYLLVLLPSFALFTGFLFLKQSPHYRNIAAVAVVLLVIIMQKFTIYVKFFSYYQNFLAFVTHKKTVEGYQAFFDRNTPKDYEIAQFIRARAKPEDTLFIWGNNAQVYKLTGKLPLGRFTVAYHMSATEATREETMEILREKKPTYIIVTSPRNFIPYALTGYIQRIAIQDALIYERRF